MADAPVDALLSRVEDVTKGWLLALLEQAPLQQSPSILAADLVRDGPRVCDAVIRALADDGDLRRIEPGGALEPLLARTGELAGGGGVQAGVRAVDALQAVIWSALREELGRPDPDQILELAERLALVIESIRGAVLRYAESAATAPGSAEDQVAPRGFVAARAGAAAHRRDDTEAGGSWSGIQAGPVHETLWIGALEDEIVRSERLGASLALLLVELEDADRIRAVESPSEVGGAFGRFAQAVRGAVRRQDILACETNTRAWIIARETGRAGATALASRVAAGVRAAAPWRGAPLTVNVGSAVLGEDGRDCASLIDVAEQAKFAAQATGAGAYDSEPPSGSDPATGSDPPMGSDPLVS